jgi:hypothetical protein
MNLHAARQMLDRCARLAITALLVSGVLAACAAPQNASQVTQPATSAPAPMPSPAPEPASATTTTPSNATVPTPAQPPDRHSDDSAARVEAPSATPVKIDTACRTNADCTVKNVGNCCGYYPACVNVDSPTDPQGVQAECARSGQMSVCGFREISTCQCVRGQCEAAAGGLDVQ